MIIELLEEAEIELFEAATWYESKETGLGKRFRNEIAHVLDRIIEDPMLWRECPNGVILSKCLPTKTA